MHAKGSFNSPKQKVKIYSVDRREFIFSTKTFTFSTNPTFQETSTKMYLEIRISKSDKSRPIKTKNNFSHRQKKKLTKSDFLFREGGMMPLPGLESERCVRGCSTAGGSVFSTKISAEK